LINELVASPMPNVDSLQTLRVAVDDTYKQIDEMSAALSGVINRLSATISSITTQVNAFSSSRSRVQDTDYAKELAEFIQIKAQQDISAATMAHLNTQPKVVLWLLQSEASSKSPTRTVAGELRKPAREENVRAFA